MIESDSATRAETRQLFVCRPVTDLIDSYATLVILRY